MSICYIAHRGYSGKYLENTEEAFVKAVEHGSGGIETDVRVTKDGVLVVCHNSEAVFEDGSAMEVSEHTYAELTEKPLLNRFTDTKLYLCTFRRYLEICRDGNMVCFIEFKGEFTDEMIDAAFTMAGEVYDLSMCELQSFHFDNLIRAHKAFPELKIMLTCGKHDEDVDRCIEYGFDIDMDLRGVEKRTVEMFHEHGLKVGLWTANTPEALAFCQSLAVDFIESDVFSGRESA
jgi:glycerophosphoryl diester phosphodiesterase